MLDNNGFVIISENTEHTGRFFGHIDGTIMDSLVQDRIYRRIALMDYQGACSDQNSPYSAAPAPLSAHGATMLRWFGESITAVAAAGLALMPTTVRPVLAWAHYDASYAEADGAGDEGDDGDDDPNYSDDYEDEGAVRYETETRHGHVNGAGGPFGVGDESATTPQNVSAPPVMLGQINSESKLKYSFSRVAQEPPPSQPKAPAIAAGPRVQPDPLHARPCDLRTDLYVLQPERLNSSTPLKGKLTNCHASGCERPFSVQKIPHSNLILLVVDTLCPCGSKQLDIDAQEVAGGTGE